MTTAKRKEKITKSTLSYSKVFGNQPVQSGHDESIDDIINQDPLEEETKKRLRLYKLLDAAKRNDDAILIEKIEKQLGIKKEEKPSNPEAINNVIKTLQQKLLDGNISDEEHERIGRTILMLQIGSNPNSANALQYISPVRPAEPRKDPLAEITADLIKSMIENKTKDEKESDMDKFIKYQKFLGENTPDPMAMIKDAKETLAAVGVDISGSKNMQELTLSLEKFKLEKEYDYKDKELVQKAESNKLMGSWIKELSSAVVEGIVDSIDEDEDDKDEKDEKQTKTIGKNVKELKIKCFNCKKMIKITSIDETREIVCEHCTWPHYYDGKKHQAQSITADKVRSDLKLEPQEFIDQYVEGSLTAEIEGKKDGKEDTQE